MTKAEKDKTLIPGGLYCYTILEVEKDDQGRERLKTKYCPYWSVDESKDDQECGHCSFMNHGDWESDGLSLLWDGVKECGENIDMEKVLEEAVSFDSLPE